MKRLLLALALFVLAAPAMAQNSPCFWSGQLVKCFPTTGIYLDNSRTLRLGTNDTTHYVELKAANGVGTSYTLTYPTAQGGSGQVLSNNGSGAYSWVTPVLTSRSISTTAPITGGGDLSADRTIAISAASTSSAGSVTQEYNQTTSAALAGGTTTPTINGRISYVGVNVCVKYEAMGSSVTKSGAGAFTLPNTYIPSTARPGADMGFVGLYNFNGTRGTYLITISSAGVTSFYKDLLGTDFANTNTFQLSLDISLCYQTST